jgi:hypothetical protein
LDFTIRYSVTITITITIKAISTIMKIWITILVAVLFNNKLRICGSKEIIVPPDPDSPDFFNCINHNMECPSWASEGGCTKDGLKEYVDVSLLIVFIENIMIDLMKF